MRIDSGNSADAISNKSGDANKAGGSTGENSGGPRPIHKGSAEQQKVIDYAWNISHDKNFIYLLKAENGDISPGRLSTIVGSNGYRDIGYCQMNKGFQSKIIKDPRFLTDMHWQIDKCYELYKGGVTFYGLRLMLKPVGAAQRARRQRVIDSFTWI